MAIVADAAGAVRAAPVDLGGGLGGRRSLGGTTWSGTAAGKWFSFQLSLPVANVFPDGLPERFLMNVVGNGLRKGRDEPVLAGFDFWSLWRPYVWAPVTIGR